MIGPRLTAEEKREVMRRIQEYFLDERGEELGELAADLFRIFLEERIAPFYYNKGLEDAATSIAKWSAGMTEQLDLLKAATARRR